MEDNRRLLGLGKVSTEVLHRTVIRDFPMHENLGLDGGTVFLNGETLISHSPSIGVPLEALGFFAFHYSASNVAERFGKLRHLIVGIYLPVNSTEEELGVITKSLGEEARRYGVNVIAGQTSTYYGLDIPLITSTCIGEAVIKPVKPSVGDLVLIAGSVGGEALWINSISEGETSDVWRSFTPLPVIMRLQPIEGVRLMHDISEGGVKRSLQEVASAHSFKLNIISNRIPFTEGLEALSQDPLRVPTYGSIIIVASPESVTLIQDSCGELGVECKSIGIISAGEGVYIDGEEITDVDRMAIDWVYGSFKGQDETIVMLRDAVNQLIKMPRFNDLIPQVGSNMAYAKTGAESLEDVASIDGRIFPARDGPRLCGDIRYGGSKFTSSVILEAIRVNPELRAAISIQGGYDLNKTLEELGHSVKKLSPEVKGVTCPVTTFISETDEIYDAYYHPGAFGIESTITIIDRAPRELLDTIQNLLAHLNMCS